ncbi:MAG: hypothetical protein ACMG57_00175 [Candidatus Dojkabacteria bacterium]
MNNYEVVREKIRSTPITSETETGEKVIFGNTGFKVFWFKQKNINQWHFTPQDESVAPAKADMEIRIIFSRMFLCGFFEFLKETTKGRSITELESTTNKTMKDFLISALGEENIESIEVDDGKYFTKIDIAKILKNDALMKILERNYNYALNPNHPLYLPPYE